MLLGITDTEGILVGSCEWERYVLVYLFSFFNISINIRLVGVYLVFGFSDRPHCAKCGFLKNSYEGDKVLDSLNSHLKLSFFLFLTYLIR